MTLKKIALEDAHLNCIRSCKFVYVPKVCLNQTLLKQTLKCIIKIIPLCSSFQRLQESKKNGLNFVTLASHTTILKHRRKCKK